MTEASIAVSNLDEPILFFGQDVTFSYPPEFEQDLAEAVAKARSQISPNDQSYEASSDDADYAQDVQREARWQVHNVWYERRYRSGSVTNLQERYNQVSSALAYQRENEPLLPLPDPAIAAEYLNACIAENYWSGAFSLAHSWWGYLQSSGKGRSGSFSL